MTTYSSDIFRVEGFAYKDQIEELFIVMVYYSQHVVNFHIFTFFNCDILFKGTIYAICAESEIKPQSINQSLK